MPEGNYNDNTGRLFKELFVDPLRNELSGQMSRFEQRITELRDDVKSNKTAAETALRLLTDPLTGTMTRTEILSRLDKQDETIDQNRKDAEKALSMQSRWAIGGILAVCFQIIQFMAQLLTTGHLHI